VTRTRNEPETEQLDERNRAAPHVNPEHSGIPTGNPQLDPGRAQRDREKATRPERK
jgi:hypothetical protein